MLILSSKGMISTVNFDHRGQMTSHYDYTIDLEKDYE